MLTLPRKNLTIEDKPLSPITIRLILFLLAKRIISSAGCPCNSVVKDLIPAVFVFDFADGLA